MDKNMPSAKKWLCRLAEIPICSTKNINIVNDIVQGLKRAFSAKNRPSRYPKNSIQISPIFKKSDTTF